LTLPGVLRAHAGGYAEVTVAIDDTDVRDLQGLETPVPAGARLLVIPSVAGG
jgi:molybdopterin converting factor small subunit